MPLCFQFSFSIFSRIGFGNLSARNRRAVTKVSENELCFSILRVGISVCGDGSDGLCCGEISHLHLCFHFFCQTFLQYGWCTLSAPNRVATTKARENECCFSMLRVVIFGD